MKILMNRMLAGGVVLATVLMLGNCGPIGCQTPPDQRDDTLPSSFIECPQPANGSVGVAQPVSLQWSYVGKGARIVPDPEFSVMVNGVVAVKRTSKCSALCPPVDAGDGVEWRVIAYTNIGVVTGKVWRFVTKPLPVSSAKCKSDFGHPTPCVSCLILWDAATWWL